MIVYKTVKEKCEGGYCSAVVWGTKSNINYEVGKEVKDSNGMFVFLTKGRAEMFAMQHCTGIVLACETDEEPKKVHKVKSPSVYLAGKPWKKRKIHTCVNTEVRAPYESYKVHSLTPIEVIHV